MLKYSDVVPSFSSLRMSLLPQICILKCVNFVSPQYFNFTELVFLPFSSDHFLLLKEATENFWSKLRSLQGLVPGSCHGSWQPLPSPLLSLLPARGPQCPRLCRGSPSCPATRPCAPPTASASTTTTAAAPAATATWAEQGRPARKVGFSVPTAAGCSLSGSRSGFAKSPPMCTLGIARWALWVSTSGKLQFWHCPTAFFSQWGGEK